MIKIYANALLYKGKLLFWRTGSNKKNKYDFYKDFLYSEISMQDENDYECRTMSFEYEEPAPQEEASRLNFLVFDKLASLWYSQFKLVGSFDEYNGDRPYGKSEIKYLKEK